MPGSPRLIRAGVPGLCISRAPSSRPCGGSGLGPAPVEMVLTSLPAPRARTKATFVQRSNEQTSVHTPLHKPRQLKGPLCKRLRKRHICLSFFQRCLQRVFILACTKGRRRPDHHRALPSATRRRDRRVLHPGKSPADTGARVPLLCNVVISWPRTHASLLQFRRPNQVRTRTVWAPGKTNIKLLSACYQLERPRA